MVEATAAGLLDALKDAERSSVVSCLTGRDSCLEAYRNGLPRVDQSLTLLSRLVAAAATLKSFGAGRLTCYSVSAMSRGWESKDVESQMEEAAARRSRHRETPLSPEQIRVNIERQSLELTRTRILKDLKAATHPRRRDQLQAALEHIERKLGELG